MDWQYTKYHGLIFSSSSEPIAILQFIESNSAVYRIAQSMICGAAYVCAGNSALDMSDVNLPGYLYNICEPFCCRKPLSR